MTASDSAPTLRSVPSIELSQHQRLQIVGLCSMAFGVNFWEMFDLLPGSSHVLAHDGDELIGHAAWVTRWLQPGELPALRTAYIESVATLPNRQGQGIGRLVMEHLVSQIQDYELAALSPAVVPFYERLGWRLWRGATAIRTVRGLEPTPDEQIMVMILPGTPELNPSDPISAEWRHGEPW